MKPTARGFAAAEFAIAGGEMVRSQIDLEAHRIELEVGDAGTTVDLTAEPSPHLVGSTLSDMVASAGGAVDVESQRYESNQSLAYDTNHASAFWSSAQAAIAALDQVRSHVEGETAGPHLWPHGFDIAFEWYSPHTFAYEGSEASAQIAFGWYPGESQYLYVNPWPFSASFADLLLPGDATWHREGWDGAEQTIGQGGLGTSEVVELGTFVYEHTESVLRG